MQCENVAKIVLVVCFRIIYRLGTKALEQPFLISVSHPEPLVSNFPYPTNHSLEDKFLCGAEKES